MGCTKPAKKFGSAEFLTLMNGLLPAERLEALCAEHAPVARTPAKLSAAQVVSGLIYHQLQPAGTLGRHAWQLHGVQMSESAHAQRRAGLPVELFDQIMAEALRPLAEEARHPEAFYRGWRLVGVDGTEWSATNTPAMRSALPKAASRRLSSAFAKVRLVSLVELGLHQPLAAVAGPASEGELTLAQGLWLRVPDRSLVIADRGFGTPRTLYEAIQGCAGREVAWLVRVRKDIKVAVVATLADGSAVVDVPVREANGARRLAATLRLREIRAVVTGRDGRRHALRWWTTLLDPVRYPAAELAERYAQRWEHELYYRELKLDVRSSSVLTSHTLETALQELAALVLAMAVIAQVRTAAAARVGVPPQRISFLKILLLTQQLWQCFSWGRRARSARQTRAIVADFFESVQMLAILPERRARSCPRAVRQPVSSWPRKLDQPSSTAPISIEITSLP
jgi:hypothetical protein